MRLMPKVTAHLYDDTVITYEEIGKAADEQDVHKLFAYAERLEAQLRSSDAMLAAALLVIENVGVDQPTWEQALVDDESGAALRSERARDSLIASAVSRHRKRVQSAKEKT